MPPHAVEVGRLLSKNSRTQNAVYPGLLAGVIAYVQHAGLLKSILCYCLLVALYAVVVSINNLADLKTDTLNRRDDNPLVGDKLDSQYVYRFIGVCLAVVLVIQAFMVQPVTCTISGAYLFLGYVYSDRFFNIKSRGLWGTLLLCCCYGAIPALLGLSQGDPLGNRLLLQVVSVSLVAGSPIVLAKDYKDVEGDRLTGKSTPLVRYGIARLRFIAGCLIAGTLVLYVVFVVQDRRDLTLACVLGAAYAAMAIGAHYTQRATWLRSVGLRLVLLLMPLSLFYM
jgi:4-hydroxybenzoate polyprenyltransferase